MKRDAEKEKRLLESLDRGPGTVWRNEVEGGIIREGTTRGSRAHGPFREWFPGGQLRVERGYRNGKLHGLCRQYASDGRLLAEFTMQEATAFSCNTGTTGTCSCAGNSFTSKAVPVP